MYIFFLLFTPPYGGGNVKSYFVVKPNLVFNLGFTIYPGGYNINSHTYILTHNSNLVPVVQHMDKNQVKIKY